MTASPFPTLWRVAWPLSQLLEECDGAGWTVPIRFGAGVRVAEGVECRVDASRRCMDVRGSHQEAVHALVARHEAEGLARR